VSPPVSRSCTGKLTHAARQFSQSWPRKVYSATVGQYYVIGFGALRVLGIKEVDWRGIRYRLSTSGVQMQGYTPFGAMDPSG